MKMTDSVEDQKTLKAAQNNFIRYGFQETPLQQVATEANDDKHGTLLDFFRFLF